MEVDSQLAYERNIKRQLTVIGGLFLATRIQADINFTKDLFEAANRMRGSVAPSEYKHIVLPLIFLRYLSLRYEKRRAELEEMVRDPKSEWYMEDTEMREEIISDVDQYRSQQVYVIPEQGRWSYLVKNAKQPNIKEILDNAMRLIEEENEDLEGVLPRIYQASNLPSDNLGELIQIFSREVFSMEDSVDVLGRVYEYFIGNFVSTEGNRGGEFFTPSSIVQLLVAMLEPISGVVFDPACGSGGMFIQSEQYTSKKNVLTNPANRKHLEKPRRRDLFCACGVSRFSQWKGFLKLLAYV